MAKPPKPSAPTGKAILTDMPLEARKLWIEQIIGRLMQAWDITERKVLAKKLGYHDNSVGNWISKGTIPWASIYVCHRETGRSMDWLVNGTMPEPVVSALLQSALRKEADEIPHLGVKMGLINKAADNGLELFGDSIYRAVITLLKSDHVAPEKPSEGTIDTK